MHVRINAGFHTSIAGGLHRSVDRIVELGCSAMQIFARNPRSWRFTPVGKEEVALFRSKREESGINPVAVHTTYLINLSSPDDDIFEKSLGLFKSELALAEALGADYLVTHLGSSRGAGGEFALRRVKYAMTEVKKEGLAKATTILAENSAGSGESFGSDLSDIGAVLDHADSIGLKNGLCFDTCHGFAAGYPMRTRAEVKALAPRIEREAGLGRLKLLHLNDSKGGFNSRVDRHEDIGKGRIGPAGLEAVLKDPVFSRLPIIMETPRKDKSDDLRNLKALIRFLK